MTLWGKVTRKKEAWDSRVPPVVNMEIGKIYFDLMAANRTRSALWAIPKVSKTKGIG